MKYSLMVVLIPFLTSCYSSRTSVNCEEYDWNSVERMVEPYITDGLYTALVMQAQSSEYKVAAAADHALGLSETYPDSLVLLLKDIRKDC